VIVVVVVVMEDMVFEEYEIWRAEDIVVVDVDSGEGGMRWRAVRREVYVLNFSKP